MPAPPGANDRNLLPSLDAPGAAQAAPGFTPEWIFIHAGHPPAFTPPRLLDGQAR